MGWCVGVMAVASMEKLWIWWCSSKNGGSGDGVGGGGFGGVR